MMGFYADDAALIEVARLWGGACAWGEVERRLRRGGGICVIVGDD